MWVRVYLRIRSSNLSAKSEGLEADFQMKIERSMKGSEFKNILQKTVLMIWNERCENIKEKNDLAPDKLPSKLLENDNLDKEDWDQSQKYYVLTGMSVKALPIVAQ